MRVLLHTGKGGVGKTTMALSLGRASALSGARTVVVDADLRHPSVAKTLGLDAPLSSILNHCVGGAFETMKEGLSIY